MKILEEANVQYSHEPPDEDQLIFTEFTYTSWYQILDKRYINSVWIIGGRHRMLELINAWNKKDPKRWHYML